MSSHISQGEALGACWLIAMSFSTSRYISRYRRGTQSYQGWIKRRYPANRRKCGLKLGSGQLELGRRGAALKHMQVIVAKRSSLSNSHPFPHPSLTTTPPLTTSRYPALPTPNPILPTFSHPIPPVPTSPPSHPSPLNPQPFTLGPFSLTH